MSILTWLGSLAVLGPLVPFVAWRRLRAGRRAEALFPVLALAGAALLARAVKLWVARPPSRTASSPRSPAARLVYPSAHVMQMTATALALALLWLPRARRWRTTLMALFTTLVMLVVWSRLYLQVHFPSDPLFGMAASALWVAGLAAWMPPLRERMSHAQ